MLSTNEVEVAGIEEPEYRSEEEKDVDFCDTQDKFILTSTVEDGIFREFQQWLCGPDGGYKPHRSAKDRKNTLLIILKSVTEYGSLDYKNLLEKPFLERWMVYGEEQLQPGTIKTYLQAVINFYDFLEVSKGPADEGLVTKISRMRIIIRRWQGSLYKKIEERPSVQTSYT